jgi:hypothetical protein
MRNRLEEGDQVKGGGEKVMTGDESDELQIEAKVYEE